VFRRRNERMIADVPKEKLLELYRNLVTARLVGDKLLEMFKEGVEGIPWVHRSTGEEAIPIGICANLRKTDYLKVTTRTRVCLFAKGLSIRDVLATECHRDLPKVGGHYCYFDMDYGLVCYSGTLGEDVPVCVGAALGAKLKKTDQVTVAIFGDGTGNRGSIHESMAVAAAWKLPIVFVIQNNQYGFGTSVRKSYAIEDLSDRAKAYGFPGVTVDGNDIIEVYEVSKEYIDRARSGGGPGLIAAETYRLWGHQEGDPQTYRPEGESEEWWKKDPLPRYRKRLMEMNILTEVDVSRMDEEIRAEVDAAAKEAQEIPHPVKEDYVKTAVAEL
jgi:pyruvate dehydrogenase E1 component alpha subunit